MKSAQFNRLVKDIGNIDSFNKLYSEYYPFIVKYTDYIYKGKNIGKDVAQEIFAYLLTHRDMPYVDNPNGWVRTLCKNIGAKRLNKELPLPEYFDNTVAGEAQPADGIDDIVYVLAHDEREIILLKYRYRFTLKEIAEMKNLSYVALLKQHNRILKKLKKFLSKKS